MLTQRAGGINALSLNPFFDALRVEIMFTVVYYSDGLAYLILFEADYTFLTMVLILSSEGIIIFHHFSLLIKLLININLWLLLFTIMNSRDLVNEQLGPHQYLE